MDYKRFVYFSYILPQDTIKLQDISDNSEKIL